MAHNLEIRATARGPDFYYREVHEWAHGTEEGTQGVEAVTTHALMHTALPRDADVISQILQRLTSSP